jgi:hypothetical protein
LNIALRRAAGELVLIADATAWPTGDALAPLAETLSDPDVAVAGAFGVASEDPGRLRPASLAPSTAREVGAVLAGWMAFRRADYIALGPLDERFVTSAWLDVWWSLRLRCGADPDWTETDSDAAADGATDAEAAAQSGETPADEPEAAPPPMPDLPAPRRAVLINLPLGRDEVAWPPDRSRLNRRNMYRILDRYGWRDDLG